MTEKGRKHKRVAAAVSVSAAVGVFAVLGSTGLAQTALAPAQNLVAQNQSAQKVEICHKGRNTISISVNALPAHLGHGDTESACTLAAGTTETANVEKAKSSKTESTESAEPSATEEAERPMKPTLDKAAKVGSAGKQKAARPAWGKSKKRTGLGRSSEISVVAKAKKAKKSTNSAHGHASPPGLGGASPPAHASGKGGGKNK